MGDSATLIDNIFTNCYFDLGNTFQCIIKTDITDHFPVIHVYFSHRINKTETYTVRRNLSHRNKNAFLGSISTVDWYPLLNDTDMQSAFGMFHSKLLELYNKHFPKQRFRYRYNSRKPWLSQGLKDGIKTKNKLYIKYIKITSVYNEIKYKNYRNKLSSILRNAEKKYYSDLLTENKHNIKKTWQIMKTVINKNRVKHIHAKFKLSDGSITSDKCLISEKFNDFFVGIGPNLAKKIPSQNLSPLKYMGQPLLQSMFLSVVTPDEVKKIIKSLKSGAAGYDELSASILKWYHHLLLALLPTCVTYHLIKVSSQGNWNLQMWYPYTKRMTHAVLIITDLYLYCVCYQRFSKRLCIIAWWNIWIC